jgi:multidrug efflux pump subunit AcrA (membrane-fusion protein)
MRISAIAAAPSGSVDGTDAPGYRVAFMPSGPLPGGIVGKSIAITTGTRSTGPQVLIVPVASISTGASGRTYVTVATAAGRERDVTVRLGLSTGGEQAVSPVGGALKPGESVVIGSAAAGSG